MRPDTEPWWRQAQAEIACARQLMYPDAYFAAAWFSHQAVEKGLKALLFEASGNQPRRTHDLLYLAQAVAVPRQQMMRVAIIDPAFKFTRYPDIVAQSAPVDIVTEAIAIRLLDAAEEVITWLATQL